MPKKIPSQEQLKHCSVWPCSQVLRKTELSLRVQNPNHTKKDSKLTGRRETCWLTLRTWEGSEGPLALSLTQPTSSLSLSCLSIQGWASRKRTGTLRFTSMLSWFPQDLGKRQHQTLPSLGPGPNHTGGASQGHIQNQNTETGAEPQLPSPCFTNAVTGKYF